MSDKKFKWLVCSIAVVIIAVTGMVLLVTKEEHKASPKGNSLKEYVYIDEIGILHVDRKCSRLNYKGVQSERYKVNMLSKSVFNSYCPKCVSDEDYNKLDVIPNIRPRVKVGW